MGLGLAVMEAIKKQHPKEYAAMVRQLREADKKKAAKLRERK